MQRVWRPGAACVLVALIFLSPSPAAGAESTPVACPVDYDTGRTEHPDAGAVYYEIFVRSFADSDGDGVGDFKGLTARLDYLNDGDPATDTDLAIDGIWLMPITQSPSYHGYDTVDYDAVDDEYGTEEDFLEFLAEAKRRGIRVVMDLVVNHCSREHPWFQQASESTDSPYHDWFVWRRGDPGWSQPWSSAGTWHRAPALDLYYYGLFWAGMPDLNYENPETRAEMIAIAKRWLAKGLDGFRLDASRHIIEAGEEAKAAGSPETHRFWIEFGAAVRAEYPDALLLGENWTSIEEVSAYFGDAPATQLDMSFNFELAGALVETARDGRPEPVLAAMCEVARHYPPHALDATFLTNHDMRRVLTQLGDDRRKARLAAGLLLTLPGVPFLYYGEEIGLRNGPGDEDPEKRTPMRWTAAGGFTTGEPWMTNRKADPAIHVEGQRSDPDSLWHLYRRFIALRQEHPALALGGYRPATVRGDAARRVLAFERHRHGHRLLVVANLRAEPLTRVQVELADPSGRRTRPLAGTAAKATAARAVFEVEGLEPYEVAVFAVAAD